MSTCLNKFPLHANFYMEAAAATMQSLPEINLRMKEIATRVEEIQTAYKGVNLNMWKPESLTEMQKLLKEEKDLADKKAQAEAQTKELEMLMSGRPRAAGTSQVSNTPARIGNQREGFESDPNCGFTNHGEFFAMVRQASTNGANSREAHEDPRMRFLMANTPNTGDNPQLGWLVPESVSREVTNRTAGLNNDPLAPYITNIQMDAPTATFLEVVSEDMRTQAAGGFKAYRRDEHDTMMQSMTKLKRVKFATSMMYVAAITTMEMQQESQGAFNSLMDALVPVAFTERKMQERIRGTGTDEFEGILNCPGRYTVTKTSNDDELSADDLIMMMAHIWNMNTCVWIAHPSLMPKLSGLSRSSATGVVSIYHYALQDGVPDRLLGRPIIYTQYASLANYEGDIILANLDQYEEGVLGGRQRAESIHVRFFEHENCFKFWENNVGKSRWRRTVKLKAPQGATRVPTDNGWEMSPFVVLSERVA